MGYYGQVIWSLALLGSTLLRLSHTCDLGSARDCPHSKMLGYQTLTKIFTDDNVDEHCGHWHALFNCIPKHNFLEGCNEMRKITHYQLTNITNAICETWRPEFKGSVGCFKRHLVDLQTCERDIRLEFRSGERHCQEMNAMRNCFIEDRLSDCEQSSLWVMERLLRKYQQPLATYANCDDKELVITTRKPEVSTEATTEKTPSSALTTNSSYPTIVVLFVCLVHVAIADTIFGHQRWDIDY